MAESVTAGGLEFVLKNRGQREDGDGGPSMQVLGMVNGAKEQLLRFDMFRVSPHYHYAPHGHNERYSLDPLILDDGVTWTMDVIARKLPQMLGKAGYESLAAQIPMAEIKKSLPYIETRWRAQEPSK